ncbi:MAG: hypothetical protein HYU99_04090 [Deltaproteobacteria bacterium]|nr:hypothetical protein [Deltaproteobacteria bacterium]
MTNPVSTLSTRQLLEQFGPIDLSPLPDTIESEFTPEKFSRTLFEGLLKGDSLDEITDKVFGQLPEQLETEENRSVIRELVTRSIRNVLPAIELKATGEVDNHILGALSKKYETGGRGPGTVSSGKGDHGGVSYGSYQFATNQKTPQEFLGAEGRPWAGEFAGLAPGTPEFSKKWKEIAEREPGAFQQAQHVFIQHKYYDTSVQKIYGKTGIDIRGRSSALKDVVWSTAVQHGPYEKGGAGVVMCAIDSLKGKIEPSSPYYDGELIKAIYAERGRKNAAGTPVHFEHSATNIQNGISKRFDQELKEALMLLINLE